MKSTIALINILLLFNSCMEKKPTYSWSPAVTALKEYPMEVFSGHLIIGKDIKGAYTYLPFNSTIKTGLDWEESTSDNLHYPPRFLDISWYSFTEKKTYSGIFELDYKGIEQILQKESICRGAYDEKEKKLLFNYDHSAYIKVGLLPGGVVRIWVVTLRDEYEVGRYQSEQDHTIDWKTVYPDFSMEEVANSYNEELPQKIKEQIAQNRIPLGSWERLFNRYNIALKTLKSDSIDFIEIKFANAEKETVLYNNGEVNSEKQRGIPMKIFLEWRNEEGIRMANELTFDQEKMVNLFETINANEKNDFIIKVDKTVKINEEGKGLILSLENATRKIDLSPYIKKQETYKSPNQYPVGTPHAYFNVPILEN
ncbi:DUF2931 family protein [Flavobacterium sp.]|uniref:DUF2931 family protein n=3 Tax=Flavobacterium sp. TaxID=239 RepID=UPI004048DAF2